MKNRHIGSPVRLRHVDGELLRRRDLADEAAAETDRRGLHVRAVHDTWGVALGYEVGLASDVMTVGPGVAYDCAGQEIVAVQGTKLPPPAAPPGLAVGVSFAFDLVVAR